MFAALGALVGLLLSLLNVLGGRLPASLVVAAAGVGVVAGALLGALIARGAYFGPRLNAKDEEIAVRDETISRLKIHRDRGRRHEAYAKHVHLLLRQLHGDGIHNEEDALLLEPARIMERATGVKVRLSMWVQSKPTLGLAKWKIERAPDHTEREQREFAVPLKDSWLFYMGNLARIIHEETAPWVTQGAVSSA